MAHPAHIRSSRRRARRGMTLVELAVTLMIAGLLAIISGPMVRTALNRFALEEAAQEFASALVEAQSIAIKKNASVTVARVGTTGYTVDGGPTRLLPTGVTFASGAPASVTFASFGPPITGTASITLQWETKSKTITVNAAGRVLR